MPWREMSSIAWARRSASCCSRCGADTRPGVRESSWLGSRRGSRGSIGRRRAAWGRSCAARAWLPRDVGDGGAMRLQALDGTDGYGVRPVFERVSGSDRCAPSPPAPSRTVPHERFHRRLKAETGQPVAGQSHRPAASLQPLPGDLQPGASARSARAGPSGLALAALTALVPRAPAGSRVPRALSRAPGRLRRSVRLRRPLSGWVRGGTYRHPRTPPACGSLRGRATPVLAGAPAAARARRGCRGPGVDPPRAP